MRIAISGGSGSLGRALIRKLVGLHHNDRIVTFSRDEQKRAALAHEYRDHPNVKVYAGDVRDLDRLSDILHGCEVVIHAAARKVVSGHHDEPSEMLQTNVVGTQHMMVAARRADARKFLFISSDKAVHPQNVYGVSKAMAEHLVISENARSWPRGLRLSVMRYGNVIASNGSVVRVWRDALAAGRPLPISDLRMTRFWLTLDMATDFVMSAVGQMRGGEVFVPHLKAASIAALAKAIDPDGTRVDLGIRAGGEKLHEELLSEDEARRTIVRPSAIGGWFYIVAPSQTADSWDTSPWVGDSVADGFAYRSDTWGDRWTPEELRDLLEGESCR